MIKAIYKILPKGFYRHVLKPRIQPLLLFIGRREKNSEPQFQFIQKLNAYKVEWKAANKKIILTQIIEDHAYCIKLAACSALLARKDSANIALYDAELGIERNRSYNYNRWNYFFSEKFTTRLDRIFLAFAGKVIYRNSNLFHDKEKIDRLYKDIKSKISNKSDVLAIEIEGIVIGDLVYDTYLRFANKPTVDIADKFLDDIIIEAINIFFICKQKLEQYEVKGLVSSYVAYTKHGIIARICLQKNIPVYTIGAYYSLVHKVLNEYPSHSNNHFLFHKLFQKIDKKEELLSKYKSVFEKRFTGEIDAATAYMKSSAFSNTRSEELASLDWSNTIVLLAHCFFDSPHIYRSLLFPDFYEWITFTLDTLKEKKNLTILVKQHPNGLEANDEIFDLLREKYINTNIKFIDKKTSNIQFFESRPKAIITAYGTAAAEFAYQGFPVLTIYDNPFTAFDFTYLSKSIEEYKKYLQCIETLKPKQYQNEIIEYYYMQHFHFLKTRNADYLEFTKYKGQTYSDDFLVDYLPKMDKDYFEKLDLCMKDGFEMINWELTNLE